MSESRITFRKPERVKYKWLYILIAGISGGTLIQMLRSELMFPAITAFIFIFGYSFIKLFDSERKTVHLTQSKIIQKSYIFTRSVDIYSITGYSKEWRATIMQPSSNGPRYYLVLRLDVQGGKPLRLPLQIETEDGLYLRDVVVAALDSEGIPHTGKIPFEPHFPAYEAVEYLGFDTRTQQRKLRSTINKPSAVQPQLTFGSRNYAFEVMALLSLTVSFVAFAISFIADKGNVALLVLSALTLLPPLYAGPSLWRHMRGVKVLLTENDVIISKNNKEDTAIPIDEIYLLLRPSPGRLLTNEQMISLPKVWNAGNRTLTSILAERLPGRVQDYSADEDKYI